MEHCLTIACRIFILEGIFTVVVAALSKFVIVDWPETAKFLTEEERELLIARLAADVADSRMNRLDKQAYKRILTDWKIYCGILMYFSIVNNGYAVSVSLFRDLAYKRHSLLTRYSFSHQQSWLRWVLVR